MIIIAKMRIRLGGCHHGDVAASLCFGKKLVGF